MINEKDKKILIDLISNEQIHMIIKNHERHESEEYKYLETLKVKIKEMGDGYEK